MNLDHLLNPQLIHCNLKGNDRETIYREMLTSLDNSTDEKLDTEEMYQAIVEHEGLIGMPYEMGLAIPHNRCANLHDLHIVVGIHKEGVVLKPEDTEPSKIIIMCLISKSTSNIYLLTLRAISMFCMTPGNMDKLIACNTPDEVMHVFAESKVEVKHRMTAEDVMHTEFPTIQSSDTLKTAIDRMAESGATTLPVVNDNQKFCGVVSAESVMRAGIPEYIMMMDNLKFLPNLEPFEDLLQSEDTTTVEKFINREPEKVSASTPLIQIIVRLVKREAYCFYVVDEAGQLKGIISYQDLIRNVLRA